MIATGYLPESISRAYMGASILTKPFLPGELIDVLTGPLGLQVARFATAEGALH